MVSLTHERFHDAPFRNWIPLTTDLLSNVELYASSSVRKKDWLIHCKLELKCVTLNGQMPNAQSVIYNVSGLIWARGDLGKSIWRSKDLPEG